MTDLGEKAVVVGGGIAGLLSARVLSDHFAHVLLVERDEIPERPGPRRGVPQGEHLHALLPGGFDVMSRLLPGFADDLAAAGSIPAVAGQDVIFYRPEGKSYAMAAYVPEPRPLGVFHLQTRGLLEHCVRVRVDALPNVTSRNGTGVRDPLVDNGRIRGVVLDGERITADLVVDAAGRASRTQHWLEPLGYEGPPESGINCDLAYVSALIRPADPAALGEKGFFLLPPLDGEYTDRGAATLAVEGGAWLVTLAGRYGDYPPTNISEFIDFAKTLVDPVLHELITNAELLTEPVRYKYPRSIRRHYERLDRFPEGLVPIGDAICHYNPAYGQGMSASARQVVALEALLTARAAAGTGLSGLAPEFFPMAFEETRGPWLFAAALDFMNPQCTGDFPMDEAPVLTKLQALTTAEDEESQALMGDLFTMTKPLSALEDEVRQ